MTGKTLANPVPKRSIRTFVMRQGRMTPAQQRSIATYWPLYGLDLSLGVLNFDTVFKRRASVIVEIGFGMGDSLIEMAKTHPENDYIGIEVHPPGVGRCLHLLHEHGLSNLRLFKDDALTVFEQCIAKDSLSGVQVFFPDPWHKKKHHKRRLINIENVALFCQRLQVSGFLHLATDWDEYASVMLEVLESSRELTNVYGPNHFAPKNRPHTKFERRGERLGHKVFDLHYTKNSEP